MSESPTLHEFATRTLDQGADELYIDVSTCHYLDSTFLGSLLDMHRRYGRGNSPRFHVIAPADVRQKLFAPTHLHKVFHFEDAVPGSIACWVDLCPSASPSKADLARHVMECHRRLAELDCPGQKSFAAIADQLERELTPNPQK
jgi:anti-anti-sigma regulatory factor